MLRGASRIAALLATSVLGAAACDPCTGLSSCGGGPRVVLAGQMVHEETGRPVSGARLELVAGDWSTAPGSRWPAVTDARGLFTFSVPAARAGATTAELVVTPPDGEPFHVPAIAVTASSTPRDERQLGPITPAPYFPYFGELYYRFLPGDQRVGNVEVEFRRTGGMELYGPEWRDGAYRARTEVGAGRVALFMSRVYARGVGDVVGDLTIFLPPPYRPSVARGIRLTSTIQYHAPIGIIRIGAGPNLSYLLHVLDERSGSPLEGVRVEFARTGGIAATPEVLGGRTDVNGDLLLQLYSADSGVVVGTLRLWRPGATTPATLPGIELATFDDEAPRVYPVRIGPSP